MTRSESCNEDVKIGRGNDIAGLQFVMNFDAVLRECNDGTHIVFVTVQERYEWLRLREFLNLGFVDNLAELPPH